jgi:hypothetical protein
MTWEMRQTIANAVTALNAVLRRAAGEPGGEALRVVVRTGTFTHDNSTFYDSPQVGVTLTREHEVLA